MRGHPCSFWTLAWVLPALVIAVPVHTVHAQLAPPDAYEFAPYDDDSSETTRNILGDEEIQPHTLDTPTDQDWGIVIPISTNSVRIALFDYVVPANTGIYLDVFDNGLANEPQSVFARPTDSVSRNISWEGAPGSIIYWRVRACSQGSPIGECQPSDFDSEASYNISFHTDTGNVTGKVLQVDSCAVSVPIPLDDILATESGRVSGFNVYRTMFPGTGEETGPLNGSLIPVPDPTCQCGILGTGFTECTEYIDQFADIGCPSGFKAIVYRLEKVYNDGTPAVTLERFTGTLNPFANPGNEPLCETPDCLDGDANCDGIVTPGDAQAAFECYMDQVCPQTLLDAADVCAPFGQITPGDAERVFYISLDAEGGCP